MGFIERSQWEKIPIGGKARPTPLCLWCTEVVPQAGSKQASRTGMAVMEEPTDTQAGRPGYLETCSEWH